MLAVHISGRVEQKDYIKFVSEFERLVIRHGKINLFFDMTEFRGWDAGGWWADTQFAVDHYGDIRKLAMIGDSKWQQVMAVFSKPFTKSTIRYFVCKDAKRARSWMDE